MREVISHADLILNANGSIYHLDLLPDEIADTILLVGDPDRVPMVSQFFSTIEVKKQKREFVTHTGLYQGERVSVISTGIGVGNIDIVLNEVDALFNVDFATRQVKPSPRRCRFIRLGTCGSLHQSAPVDSLALSYYGVAFDTLLAFYQRPLSAPEKLLTQQMREHFAAIPATNSLSVAAGDAELIERLSPVAHPGITLTSIGFYAPQGRQLRAELKQPKLLDLAQQFDYHAMKILNLEMETAAIYGLGRALGHSCCSISAILANRATQQVSANPKQAVNSMIQTVLQTLYD